MTVGFAPLSLGVLALALAACSGGEEEGAGDGTTLEEASAEAAELERPRPGQYEQTVTITDLEIPNAPAGVAEQMRAMIEGGASQTYCLTEEQAERGFEEMYRQITEEDDCTYDRFAVEDGSVDALLACNVEGGGNARFAMNGDVTPEGTDMQVDMAIDGGQMDMNLAMQVRSRRVGDCPA